MKKKLLKGVFHFHRNALERFLVKNLCFTTATSVSCARGGVDSMGTFSVACVWVGLRFVDGQKVGQYEQGYQEARLRNLEKKMGTPCGRARMTSTLETYTEAGGGAQGTQGLSKNCTSRESTSPSSRLIRGFRNKNH